MKTTTDYDKKVVREFFISTVEWLEKYIELTYQKDFPDWENRKQIRDSVVLPKAIRADLNC